MKRSSIGASIVVIIMVAILFAALGLLSSCGGVGDAPPPPSGFLLTAPSNTTLVGVGPNPTLTWTDAVGETGYTAQISTSPTFTTNTYSQVLPADTTSYVVSSPVITGVQYYWQVLATNKWGATKASNAPFTFTP
jgi:hypothetical protein